ncbi:MAG TPA: diguanylate cyclase, partial [Blastocatellia bacterium]|nr:diguanylate cyclase [Blastocatellia bacterium]
MDSERRQRIVTVYTWLVIAIGAALCYSSGKRLSLSLTDVSFFMLVALTTISISMIVVKFSRFQYAAIVSDIFIYLVALLVNSEAAVVLGAAGSLISSFRYAGEPLKIAFRTGATACAIFLTTEALRSWAAPARLHYIDILIALVEVGVLIGVPYVVNFGLNATAEFLASDEEDRPVLLGQSWRALLGCVCSAVTAVIIKNYLGATGFYAFAAVVPLITVVTLVCFSYLSYHKYMKVSAAQAERAERYLEELQESEERYRTSFERFRSAFDHAPIGMALVAPYGGWLQVNQSFCTLVGYSEEELLAMDFQTITHPKDLYNFVYTANQVLAGKLQTHQMELRFLHKQGHKVWVSVSISIDRDPQSRAQHLIFQIQDITDRKRAEEQLLHEAFHDALTGLPNRAWFMDQLRAALARVQREGTKPFAVLFLDLDRFKIINDSLGHMIGDQLLIGIADRLRGCLRSEDIVARLGGDEFTILLQDGAEATTVAERIQKVVSQPFNLGGYETFTTASIGIAFADADYQRAEDLLRDADTAMYQAKSLGKARHALFDKSMHTNAMNLLQLETDLRRAIERKEFFVEYQPIMSLL